MFTLFSLKKMDDYQIKNKQRNEKMLKISNIDFIFIFNISILELIDRC